MNTTNIGAYYELQSKRKTAMKEIDFERAMLLMGIMEKQANVSPMLSVISGEASQELKAIAEDCRQNALERADKTRQEEQVVEQQRLEAAQANVEPLNPDPQPRPTQVYMPGEPDPNVRSEDVLPRTDKDQNADGLEDAQEPLVDHSEPTPVVGRRV
jgi:hypothetical protein